MDTFEIFDFHHRGMDCTGMRLGKDDPRNQEIRKIPGIRWSATNRCWYGPRSAELQVALEKMDSRLLAAGIQSQTAAEWKPEAEPSIFPGPELQLEIDAFRKHIVVMRYSQHTLKNYTGALMEFLRYFRDRNWRDLDAGDLEQFQQERVIDRNLSASYQNTLINAIKMFYQIHNEIRPDPQFLQRPRRAKRLPMIISQENLAKLFQSVENQKHRMMLCTIYALGLRAGELIKLKPGDIDSARGVVMIHEGKGDKDRVVPISEKLIGQLREYYKIYRPMTWLFEGQEKGRRYSYRSLQMVFTRAKEKAGLDPRHHLHDLRHSYATHIMEAGTSSRVIQELLGHKSLRTTEIYTQVSNTFLLKVYNPFDNLKM